MIRVVVTGLGLVTPIGNDVQGTWQGLMEGRSGIRDVTLFDTSAYDYAIGGEVRDFVPDSVMEAKDLRHIDRFCQFLAYRHLCVYMCVGALGAAEDIGQRCDRGDVIRCLSFDTKKYP